MDTQIRWPKINNESVLAIKRDDFKATSIAQGSEKLLLIFAAAACAICIRLFFFLCSQYS